MFIIFLTSMQICYACTDHLNTCVIYTINYILQDRHLGIIIFSKGGIKNFRMSNHAWQQSILSFIAISISQGIYYNKFITTIILTISFNYKAGHCNIILHSTRTYNPHFSESSNIDMYNAI